MSRTVSPADAADPRPEPRPPRDGVVAVDKPAGVTSRRVVDVVARCLGTRAAGHAGTLDPLAEGVVLVCLGTATRLVDFLHDLPKHYAATFLLGRWSPSDDLETEVVVEEPVQRPDRETIAAALGAFRGEIEQVPPQFSAVKVDGERAYDLAREGEVMDLAARPLWVERLEMIGRPDADHVDLEMVCGKGGYVRSIARDLGRALGCLGHVAWLRREWSGPFNAGEGVSLEEIDRLAKSPEIDALLLPLELGLADLPELPCTPEGAVRLKNGNPGMVFSSTAQYGDEAWASYQGRPVAVGIYKAGELHPSRVFNLD